ncbi:MAG TPA: ATP-dependent DNA helicase RecG [Fibrobacteraceae bacterium]|nr:ATP-dependent DNA helicase RecG [Fibrobacteraceae bacterium]
MDLSHIPGLGPRRLDILRKAGFVDIPTLLRNIPRTWLDRTRLQHIADLHADESAVVMGEIVRAGLVFGRRKRFVAHLRDDSGELQLLFFSGLSYWQKRLQRGSRWLVMGRVQDFRGPQIVHPELQAMEDTEEFHGSVVPVYSISEEMRAAHMEQAFFRKLYAKLFETSWLRLSDACPTELLYPLGFLPELDNLRRLHLPRTMGEAMQGRRQLKVMELLPFCLRMVQRRRRMASAGQASVLDMNRMKAVQGQLPFSLTEGQSHVLNQILHGLAEPRQFHALLQGDVGSGKTVVALLTLLAVASSQCQCALMVPTDILARQHFQTLHKWFLLAGLRIELLVGASKGEDRRRILKGLADGAIHAVVGTQALFSSDVLYASLRLVIVDEQHRFGVAQREALLAKGPHPDLVVMSATPIPRSLAMTLYGDLEPIVMKGKPPGRKPVKTRLLEPAKRADLKAFLHKECLAGTQAYWIVSRVEEDGVSEAHSVESLCRELTDFASDWNVGHVHGRMDEALRDQVLRNFAEGRIHVLVGTTVVEVGVNVPNANLMVIDQPERFGLAQLHQLRGRVGRGGVQAWCFLVVDSEHSAQERLLGFSQTLDGFEIAEMDLRYRGAGNLEGAEQSGSWVLRWFDWLEDQPLIHNVIHQAEKIIDNVFGFDEGVRQSIDQWYADRTQADPGRDGVH